MLQDIDLHLDHVALETPQRAVLQTFYCDQLDLTVVAEGDGFVALEGRERRLVLIDGAVQTLRHYALAAATKSDVDRTREILGEANIALNDVAGEFGSEGLAFKDPDGVEIRVVTSSPANKDHAGLPGRLQHVVVTTAQPVEMGEFYQSVVGMRLSDYVLDTDDRLMASFLRSDAEHHSYAAFRGETAKLDHFAFETNDWNDIRDWADHFARFETQIFWGPGRHGIGNNLFFMVRDPDGNKVEISNELDVLPDDAEPGKWGQSYKAYNLWGEAAIRL
jgi:catechol-2,3-dioxygenase